MEKQKRHEKGKIASSSSRRGRRRTDETMFQSFQSWRKKRRDDDDDDETVLDDIETVFQSWRKKRRDDDEFQSWRKKRRDECDDASPKSNQKDKTTSSLSSERTRSRNRTDNVRREIGMQVINNDVLEEIMVRLPLKSLLRFQIVSKHWRHTTKSKCFKERHMLHQKTQEPKILCFYEGENGNSPSTLKTMSLDWSCSTSTCLVEEGPVRYIVPLSKRGVRVSTSCDGLICIFYEDILTTPIIVTNPAIGQSQTLPLSMIQQQYVDKKMPIPEAFSIPGFGKDNVTGTYKLVWLHDHPWNNVSAFEVFDFDVKKWRYVTMDTPYDIFTSYEPVFANGWVYWLTNNQKILAYDLHSEMFRVITHKLLSQSSLYPGYIIMCSLDDRLWITDMRGENGVQHFWRIKNVLDLNWEWEKYVLYRLDFNYFLVARWRFF